jgi:ParB/RepB/Spo0J family partition protein
MIISLDKIIENPKNPNAMSDVDFKKLVSNIKRTGNCPPLIVRPMPDNGGSTYMLIDGKHRREALLKLGKKEWECYVWHGSDKEADIALATLNTLRGSDDHFKRAELIDSLLKIDGMDAESLALVVSDTRTEIEDYQRLMAVDAETIAAMERVLAPEPEDTAMKMTFALFPGQYENVRRALDHLLQQHELDGAKNADAQALEFMAIEYLSGASLEVQERKLGENLPPIGSHA